jgi:indole-3-glycerol phosphate synthase
MSSFLDRILTSRRAAIEAASSSVPLAELEREAELRPPPRDFRKALASPGMSLIAEIKRASPSRGDLRADLDPILLADAYERGGARALSVLTEPQFFKGSESDMLEARGATELPALWKDFVLGPYQVTRARSFTADAVLVIVRILDDATLRAILDETQRWGMCALVEVFDEADLERALGAGADTVGVNHRDLETFSEDPEATVRLRPLIPDGVVTVGESAISSRSDVEALESIGVDAVLVGEALIRAGDPAAKIRELLGT